MKASLKNVFIIIAIPILFIVISIFYNFENLTKRVYSYDKGIIRVGDDRYIKVYNDDFSFNDIDTSNYENIAFLNRNNYFKDNINIYSIDKDRLIYIDQFQEYQNPEEVYIYGGLYVREDYFDGFLGTFKFDTYVKEMSTNGLEAKEINLSDNEMSIIKDIVLNTNLDSRIYNGIKHDLSEFAYEMRLVNKNYEDIYLKVRVYRTKANDFVIKFRDEIYYANEFNENDYLISNVSYYTYKGDDYGYLYNSIKNEEELIDFAFHDYILQEISGDLYRQYVKEVFNILDNHKFSIKDKIICLKQILYSKYKPTLREDFALRIERVKNLNIVGDNRKTYRIKHDFLFRKFNYPADLYALAFYEDDLLYNIPERYKDVYEELVNTIIEDHNIDYIKKNDMIVELQNHFVVVDELQLEKMRNTYGEIEIIDESNERIKYSPGYYGFLYDEINDLDSLRKFALNQEVLDNIFSDYFRGVYTNLVNDILNSGSSTLKDRFVDIVTYQLKFSLISIEKQKYYRSQYRDNFFKESYISKIKSLINNE